MGLKPSPSIGRAAAVLARYVEVALSDVDLSLPQYRILIFLDESAAVASALADHSAVTRPSVTAVVDGLVSRGLVERRQDPQDRRRVEHTLTPAGRAALEGADAALDRKLKELAGFAEGASAGEVMGGLELWRRALEGYWTAMVDRLKSADGTKDVEKLKSVLASPKERMKA